MSKFWPDWKQRTSAEIEAAMRSRDERIEEFAERNAHNIATDIDKTIVSAISDEMDINASLKELLKNAPWGSHDARERIDAWIRAKKIRYTYTAHTHEANVEMWGTGIVFKEPFEHFPSDHMLAQIALALEAGVVK